MYRCQLCGEVAPAGTPCRRVVVETREARYPRRHEVHRVVYLDGAGKRKEKWRDDPGGVGRAIVREVIACPRCAAGRDGGP